MDTGVYCIQNVVSGKIYIGSAAKSLIRRMLRHRYRLNRGEHPNRHLQASWNKYGSAKFQFTVLERCSPKSCIDREQYYIDLFCCCDPLKGYNSSPTAGSPLGVIHSAETREKVSLALVGKKKSEEHQARIKAGKALVSGETRAKMALYAKNRTDSHRQKLAEGMKGNHRCLGRKLSDETKAKIAERTRQRWARQKAKVNSAKEQSASMVNGNEDQRTDHRVPDQKAINV